MNIKLIHYDSMEEASTPPLLNGTALLYLLYNMAEGSLSGRYMTFDVSLESFLAVKLSVLPSGIGELDRKFAGLHTP